MLEGLVVVWVEGRVTRGGVERRGRVCVGVFLDDFARKEAIMGSADFVSTGSNILRLCRICLGSSFCIMCLCS